MSLSYKRRKSNIALVKKEFAKRKDEDNKPIPFTLDEVMAKVNKRYVEKVNE